MRKALSSNSLQASKFENARVYFRHLYLDGGIFFRYKAENESRTGEG
jgi:hypothetical protein